MRHAYAGEHVQQRRDQSRGRRTACILGRRGRSPRGVRVVGAGAVGEEAGAQSGNGSD